MIKAAIVGLGWWGKTLVEAAENSGAIRFISGTTRTVTPDTEAFAKKNGFKLAANYEAVLADPDIDAVVLATPHSMHGAQVVAAAAAKKHIYCEKPFTLTKKEAEDAVAAVKKAGVTLALGYNRRIHPEMIKLREMVRNGELGTILHVEATMTFPNVLFINPSHWRADKHETPCGGLMPMGVHAVDGMIDLCGPIDHVFTQSFRRAAAIDADDTTSILFRMKEGMSGYLGTMTTTGPGFSLPGVRLKGLAAARRRHPCRRRLVGGTPHPPVRRLQIPADQGRGQDLAGRDHGYFARGARSLRQGRRGRPGLSDSLRPDDPRRCRDRSHRPLGGFRESRAY